MAQAIIAKIGEYNQLSLRSSSLDQKQARWKSMRVERKLALELEHLYDTRREPNEEEDINN